MGATTETGLGGKGEYAGSNWKEEQVKAKPKKREEREGLREVALRPGHPGPWGQPLEGVV